MYCRDPIFRFSCGFLWIILWWRIWLWINSYIFTICISLTKHSEESWLTADRWILSKLVWQDISHRFMMRTFRTGTSTKRYSAMKKFFWVKNFELYFDKIISNINKNLTRICLIKNNNLFNFFRWWETPFPLVYKSDHLLMAKNTIFRVSSLKILTDWDICTGEIERYGP